MALNQGPKKNRTFGVSPSQEVDIERLQVDARTLGEKWRDFISHPDTLFPVYLFFAASAILLPAAFMFVLVIWFLLFHVGYFDAASKRRMPMRLPIVHRFWAERTLKKLPLVGKRLYEFAIKDYNVPTPNWLDYEEAKGIFYFGRARSDLGSKRIYAGADDILTHTLLFGTTGSGKTETLIGMSFNSMAMGSGVIFVDPKGTNELALKVYAMARMFARDDDYLLINYATGNEKIEAFSHRRKSNTTNPFARGTADFLSDILVSLMPPSQGDNAYFSEGAVTMIKSAMYGLVEMRDQGRLNLSVRTIRQWITLEKLIDLVKDDKLSGPSREALLAYLQSVPGMDLTKPANQQAEQTRVQFGYNQSYFRRPLSSLTDTYGHVYGSLMGEVDFRDVVFNRRILLVLLPSMEKSPEELKSLGKVILSSIRSAVALGTGNVFEGTKRDMLESLPISKRKPTLIIVDEYGYVSTEGFAVLPAQARGLGAAFVFAGQDFAGFRRGSEEEAEQILANTKIKIFMTLEDVKDTWDIARNLAGEAYYYHGNRREIDIEDSLTPDFRHTNDVSLEKRARIELNDLRKQISGDFHIFYKEDIIPGHALYVPLDLSCGMRINRYCEVDTPEPAEIERRYGVNRARGEVYGAIINRKAVREAFTEIVETHVSEGDHKVLDLEKVYDALWRSRDKVAFSPDGVIEASWLFISREDDVKASRDGSGSGRRASAGMSDEAEIEYGAAPEEMVIEGDVDDEFYDPEEAFLDPDHIADESFRVDEHTWQEAIDAAASVIEEEMPESASESGEEKGEQRAEPLTEEVLRSVVESEELAQKAIDAHKETIREAGASVSESASRYPAPPKPAKKDIVEGGVGARVESGAEKLDDILDKI